MKNKHLIEAHAECLKLDIAEMEDAAAKAASALGRLSIALKNQEHKVLLDENPEPPSHQ
ncbi:MAG: hypothetical protein ACK4ZW_05685 [Blastomonas sp.]